MLLDISEPLRGAVERCADSESSLCNRVEEEPTPCAAVGVRLAGQLCRANMEGFVLHTSGNRGKDRF